MWLDEITSPSTSTSSTTRVSNASCARSSATSPLARWPKRKFSPTLTRCASSAPISTSSMNPCGDCCEKTPSNGITTSSRTPSPATRSAFVVERGDQLRRLVGRDDGARVRLEGEHGVRAAHHLAVTEVHAVELAHRHVARARLGIGEPGDVHQPRKPTTGLSVPSARGSASAISPSSSTSRTVPSAWPSHGHAVARPPRRLAVQLDGGQEAQRLVERDERARRRRRRTGRSASAAARGSRRRRGRRSASARRSPSRTRSRSRRARRSRQRCSNRCTSTSRSGDLDRLPRPRERVRAAPADRTAE